MKTIVSLGALLLCVAACSPQSTTWKEEVALHDGRNIVVERRHILAGTHEPGQIPPVRESALTFTPFGAGKPITWKSEFSEDLGHANFIPLALDSRGGTTYIVAYPYGCFAYNKWGRPNPPYVVFKRVHDSWLQIAAAELPPEIVHPNLLISPYGRPGVDRAVQSGFVSASAVAKFNGDVTQEELKRISRTPMAVVGVDCGERVRIQSGWASAGSTKAPIPGK